MDNVKSIYDLPTMKPIDVSRVVNNLSKIVIDEKSYEVSNVDGYRFVFVTGCDEDERDLQPWDHPIMIEGVKSEKIIVSDVRKYLQKIDEKPTFLTDVVKDKSGLSFIINRAIFYALVDKGDIGLFKQVQNSVATIFANVISSSINMYVDLNPKEKLLIETVVAMYTHNMFLVNYSESERVSAIKARVSNTKLSFPSLNKKEIDDIVLNIETNVSTFTGLVNNLANILPNKKEVLKEEAIYNALNSLWYGPGNVSTTLVHLEDLSTMLVLYYSAATDATYKRTRIANTINNVKRRIEVKSIENLKHVIKEYQDVQ